MKKLSRRAFTEHLYHKMNGAIPIESLIIIYDLVCEYLAQQLISKNIFSIENFGVLSPYIFKSHLIKSLNNQLVKTKEVWRVKFRVNPFLKKFLAEKRDFFSK